MAPMMPPQPPNFDVRPPLQEGAYHSGSVQPPRAMVGANMSTTHGGAPQQIGPVPPQMAPRGFPAPGPPPINQSLAMKAPPTPPTLPAATISTNTAVFQQMAAHQNGFPADMTTNGEVLQNAPQPQTAPVSYSQMSQQQNGPNHPQPPQPTFYHSGLHMTDSSGQNSELLPPAPPGPQDSYGSHPTPPQPQHIPQLQQRTPPFGMQPITQQPKHNQNESSILTSPSSMQSGFPQQFTGSRHPEPTLGFVGTTQQQMTAEDGPNQSSGPAPPATAVGLSSPPQVRPALSPPQGYGHPMVPQQQTGPLAGMPPRASSSSGPHQMPPIPSAWPPAPSTTTGPSTGIHELQKQQIQGGMGQNRFPQPPPPPQQQQQSGMAQSTRHTMMHQSQPTRPGMPPPPPGPPGPG